jgi:hypothetical protein
LKIEIEKIVIPGNPYNAHFAPEQLPKCAVLASIVHNHNALMTALI